MGSLIDAAVKHGIVEKRGSWYTCGEEKIGQGRDNAKAYLEQNADFTVALERQVREKIFPPKDAQGPNTQVATPVEQPRIEEQPGVSRRGQSRASRQGTETSPVPVPDRIAPHADLPENGEALF